MKKLVLLLWLLPTVAGLSQDIDDARTEERKRQRDSVMEYYQRKRDSLQHQIYLSDTAQIRQNLRSSAEYFLKLRQESRRKQKQAAITRIAIGMALLAFLVYVLKRKKK